MYWTSRGIGMCLPRGVALWLIISPQDKNSIEQYNTLKSGGLQLDGRAPVGP